MSAIIAKLLGWTKAPQWLLELILVVAVIGAVWFWNHSVYESGIEAQRAADAKATLAATVAANRETDRQRHRAEVAEKANADEHTALVDYQRDHHSSVRLCNAPVATAGVPAAGASAAPAAGASAAGVQQVPGRDSGAGQGAEGRDIGGLLDALAGRADEISADLREYQTRDH